MIKGFLAIVFLGCAVALITLKFTKAPSPTEITNKVAPETINENDLVFYELKRPGLNETLSTSPLPQCRTDLECETGQKSPTFNFRRANSKVAHTEVAGADLSQNPNEIEILIDANTKQNNTDELHDLIDRLADIQQNIDLN